MTNLALYLYKAESAPKEVKETVAYTIAVHVFRRPVVKQLLSGVKDRDSKDLTDSDMEQLARAINRFTNNAKFSFEIMDVRNVLLGLVYADINSYAKLSTAVKTISDITNKPSFLIDRENIVKYHLDVFAEVSNLLRDA